MATVDECRVALEGLAQRMDQVNHDIRRNALDRTISWHVRDLGTTFNGRLHDGRIDEISMAPAPRKAQIRVTSSSDDLIEITAGRLPFPAAWATGRIKVEASIFDLLKLRSLL